MMSDQHSILFRHVSIGSLHLRNRVVMAPMTRRKAATDGIATEAIAAYYRRRAAGEVGLIISEGTAIDSVHAFDTPTVPRFETPAQSDAWQRVVHAVHAEGGAFAPQLWHTGRLAVDPIGPSDCPGSSLPPRRDGTPRQSVRAMNEDDFEQVLAAFAHSARESRRIGCDALEIHGAHGYLLDSFLSPTHNQRRDDFGGPWENRLRFPLQVVRTVREEVGPDYPIIYRISQWLGAAASEMKFKSHADLETVVSALKEAGVDILHVSTRDATDPAFPDEVDNSGRTLAGWTRSLSGLPTIAVGRVTATVDEQGEVIDTRSQSSTAGVSDPGPVMALLDRKEADLLAVGRALIPNANWVQVVRDGDWRDLIPYDESMLEMLE